MSAAGRCLLLITALAISACDSHIEFVAAPPPLAVDVVAATDSTPAYETFTITSKAIGEARSVNVHLPAGYETAATDSFQVLYMPDGGLHEDFVHIVHAVDSLAAAGAIRPAIVVGIPNTERRRDLTGPTRFKADSEVAARIGGSSAFRTFIADEIIPEIGQRYRVTGERSIIGESLAGLFILETFFETPTLFTHYVALDPSLWWNGGALVGAVPSRVAAFDSARRSLYLATSHEPSTAEGATRIDSILKAAPPKNLRWGYLYRKDLEHGTIFRALEIPALADALK